MVILCISEWIPFETVIFLHLRNGDRERKNLHFWEILCFVLYSSFSINNNDRIKYSFKSFTFSKFISLFLGVGYSQIHAPCMKKNTFGTHFYKLEMTTKEGSGKVNPSFENKRHETDFQEKCSRVLRNKA